MLVDDPRIEEHSEELIFRIISGAKDGEKNCRRLAQGIYQMGHFGSSDFPGEGYVDRYAAYRLKGEEREEELKKRHLSINDYGVCDGYQQVLEQCPELHDPRRRFVLCLTPIIKADQPPRGGWRWHKWGPYIGTHDIQCEYLHDEEGIEGVLVFHIYEQEIPEEIVLHS